MRRIEHAFSTAGGTRQGEVVAFKSQCNTGGGSVVVSIPISRAHL